MNCHYDLPNSKSNGTATRSGSDSLLSINRRGSTHSGASFLSGMSSGLSSSAESSCCYSFSTCSIKKLDETIGIDAAKSNEMKSLPSCMLPAKKTNSRKSSSTNSSSSCSQSNSLNDIIVQALAVTTITSAPTDAVADACTATSTDEDEKKLRTATTAALRVESPAEEEKEEEEDLNEDEEDDLVLLQLQELLRKDLNLFRFDATCPTERTTERRWSDISCDPVSPATSPSSKRKSNVMRGVDTSPMMPIRPSY